MNKQKELEKTIAADQAAIERAKKFFETGSWDEDLTAAVLTDAVNQIEHNNSRLNELKEKKEGKPQ